MKPIMISFVTLFCAINAAASSHAYCQDDFSTQFDDALKNSTTSVKLREQAVVLSQSFDTPEGISFLTDQLKTGSGLNRKELAAQTHGKIGSTAAVDALIDIIKQEGLRVAKIALGALAENWTGDVKTSLQDIVEDSTVATRNRIYSVGLLGASGDSNSKTFLESILQNPNPAELDTAIEDAIAAIDGRISTLTGAALATREKEERAFFMGILDLARFRSISAAAGSRANILIDLGGSFSFDFLKDKLEEGSNKRNIVVGALSAALFRILKPSGGVAFLKDYAGTEKEVPDVLIFSAIESYGGTPAIDAMHEILQDDTRKNKYFAAGMLGRIATSVESAELLESLADEETVEFEKDPGLKKIYLDSAQAIRDRLSSDP